MVSTVLSKIVELLREQEIDEIKKKKRKKIEYPGWRNKRYLRKVMCEFRDFKSKMYILWGKPHDFEKERELRLSTKEKMNKIEEKL